MPRISLYLSEEDAKLLMSLARDSDESVSRTVAGAIHILDIMAGGLNAK